ncbi:MAG: NADH-quinone oxidoreductase subunit C [Lysobacteraceae bacterium]|nr:MAG: NADH-quinone oxidoreductase subunit C [Xanthomonadaceae bacterium]
MNDSKTLIARLEHALGERIAQSQAGDDMVTIEVHPTHWIEVARELREHPELKFEQLTDLCGVDYLAYGQVEWDTSDVSNEGFSRGVEGEGPGRFSWDGRPQGVDMERRFAVVIHLLSLVHNERLRVRCFTADSAMPRIDSLIDIWSCANWFEREAFDLYGILFEGHPDLRRILTDYGFVGHPFRKDFPLTGNVEVRYDEEKERVSYVPVEIEPRVLVPRVIRAESGASEDAEA